MRITRSLGTQDLRAIVSTIALVCSPSFAPADDLKYLPDHASIVVANTAISESATFKQLQKHGGVLAALDEDEFLRIPNNDFVRTVMAVVGLKGEKKGDIVIIYTAKKSISAKDVKSGLQKDQNQEKIRWKQYNFGSVNVWKRSYQLAGTDLTVDDWSFCVVGEKVVLLGLRSESLKAILTRKRAPRLSSTISSEISNLGIRHFAIVVDFDQVLASRQFRKKIASKLWFLDLRYIQNVHLFVGSVVEKQNVTAMVKLTCSNGANATQIKQNIEKNINKLKSVKPKDESEKNRIQRLLNKVKVSIAGNVVTVAVTGTPRIAAYFVNSFFTPLQRIAYSEVRCWTQ